MMLNSSAICKHFYDPKSNTMHNRPIRSFITPSLIRWKGNETKCNRSLCLGQIDTDEDEDEAEEGDGSDGLREDEGAGDAGCYRIQVDVVGTA